MRHWRGCTEPNPTIQTDFLCKRRRISQLFSLTVSPMCTARIPSGPQLTPRATQYVHVSHGDLCTTAGRTAGRPPCICPNPTPRQHGTPRFCTDSNQHCTCRRGLGKGTPCCTDCTPGAQLVAVSGSTVQARLRGWQPRLEEPDHDGPSAMLQRTWACAFCVLAAFGSFSAPALAQPCGAAEFTCDDGGDCLPEVLRCDGEEVCSPSHP